jgi:hypothetical protein
MSVQQRLMPEIKAVAISTLYFGCWIGALLLLKSLILAEYKIAFTGWSMVVVGALILSKVVLLLEHVSLGALVRNRPAWVDVLLRTILYSLGVALVLIIDKGIESRHEYGGILQAVQQLFYHEDFQHVCANTICISGALLGYNTLSAVQKQFGKGALMRIFLSPYPDEADIDHQKGTHGAGT